MPITQQLNGFVKPNKYSTLHSWNESFHKSRGRTKFSVKLFSKPESKFESEGLVSLVVRVIVRIILLRMTNGCYRSYTSLRGLTLVQLPFKLQRYRNEEQVPDQRGAGSRTLTHLMFI